MARVKRDFEGDVKAFHDKIIITPGCHFWTGSIVGGHESNNGGYGVASFQGKSQLAHRIAYKIAYGEIPADKPIIMHSCDTRKCQNPEHLVAGTKKQNSEDMVARGRAHNGAGKAYKRVSPEELHLMAEMRFAGESWYRIGLTLGRAQQLVKAKVEKYMATAKKPVASVTVMPVNKEMAVAA